MNKNSFGPKDDSLDMSQHTQHPLIQPTCEYALPSSTLPLLSSSGGSAHSSLSSHTQHETEEKYNSN